MVHIAEHLIKAAAQLDAAGVASARLDARLLMQHVLGITREALMLREKEALAPQEETAFFAAISRRVKREPLAYITGEQAFWRDCFMVTPDTLIPRADSETIIEACLQILPDQTAPYRVVDFGTGSGCLLLCILREYPNATGIGVDINPRAVTVANANAKRLGLENRARFVVGDMLAPASLPAAPETFDILISNPPYIETDAIADLQEEVKHFEPLCALDGGMQGLNFYEALLNWLPSRAHAHSVCLFEVGYGQAAAVHALAKKCNIKDVKLFNDLAGIARVVAGIGFEKSRI